MPTIAVFSREFVLDLCDGEDVVATEILYFMRLKGYSAAITPTVGQSLMDMATQDQNRTAMDSLFHLAAGVHRILMPVLPPVQNGYAGLAAEALMNQLQLPEHKKNVALIISEASVLEAKFLVLDDAELEDLEVAKVNKVLAGRGLATLQIFSRMDFFGLISEQRA